jgi:hypothetical protein
MSVLMRMTWGSRRLLSLANWPKELAAMRWREFLCLQSPQAQLATYRVAWRRFR